MAHDDKIVAPDDAPPSTHVEPPKIYIAACGALCDIFWWARRSPSDASSPATPAEASKQQT